MKNEQKKEFHMPTEADTHSTIGMRTDLDPKHPRRTIDRYPGNSVNEHMNLQEANEYLAEEEIKQVFNNS